MLEEFYAEVYRIVCIVLWRTAAIATALIVWWYGYFYFVGTEIPPILHGAILTGSVLSGLGLALAMELVQWTWQYARSQF